MALFQRVFTGLTCVTLLTGCIFFETSSTDKKAYDDKYPAYSHSPKVQMLLNDWGGLTTETLKTNAMPLKVVAASVVARRLQGRDLDTTTINRNNIFEFYKEYGFITAPDSIGNWTPGVPSPLKDMVYPVGVARGTMAFEILGKKVQFEIANVTCVACHSNRMFDAKGLPTNSVWLGAPNTSLNIEGYSAEIFESLKYTRDNEGRFYKVLDRLYPSMPKVERKSIEDVLKETIKMVNKAEKISNHILPAFSGPPGAANAIASFKKVYGMLKEGEYDFQNSGFVNIPDLSYRAFRQTAVVDGIYTLPGEKRNTTVYENEITLERARKSAIVAATFTVPVMGVDPKRSIETKEQIQTDIGAFLYEYKAQPFPGTIDESKALRGEQVFRSNCMGCHGEFSPGVNKPRLISYPNLVIPQEVIGTDAYRLNNISDDLAKKLEKTWVGKELQVTRTRGYMPPPLANVWSTAPYFHNGSVPTLWALLNPEERPATFYVGGHALDFEKVGINYPKGYKPWSKPVLVDTRRAGLSNKGHEGPVKNLTQDQKKDLIEYLKLL